MDILESVEARWFFDGEPPFDAWPAWFEKGRGEEEKPRTDLYLATGRADIGVKARQAGKGDAKVETKYLTGSLGAVDLAAGVVGVVERWQKLSLGTADGDLRAHGRWLAVEKRRRIRKLAWTDGALEEVEPSNGDPEAGAACEITALGGDVVAWTVGVEAFGPSTQLLAILEAACRTAFVREPDRALDARSSSSYAAFIDRRCR